MERSSPATRPYKARSPGTGRPRHPHPEHAAANPKRGLEGPAPRCSGGYHVSPDLAGGRAGGTPPCDPHCIRQPPGLTADSSSLVVLVGRSHNPGLRPTAFGQRTTPLCPSLQSVVCDPRAPAYRCPRRAGTAPSSPAGLSRSRGLSRLPSRLVSRRFYPTGSV